MISTRRKFVLTDHRKPLSGTTTLPWVQWISGGIALMGLAMSTVQGAPMKRVSSHGDHGFVTVEGVTAGPFNAKAWEHGTLNFTPDARWPLLDPLKGAWRNIYAPTVVSEGTGFRLYYGGWDGSPTGNDRLYSIHADRDFLHFTDRRTVVENGPFIHVNNGSAVRASDGTVRLMATQYPDSHGMNKPALFISRDGARFAGREGKRPAGNLPYSASATDFINIVGYPNFEKADINGMNALFRDGNQWRLYFGDFKNWGKVYRASGTDPRRLTLEGPALNEGLMVNDVKRFQSGGNAWNVMLLHQNGDHLRYSLSRDAARFPPSKTLFINQGPEDRYIVAVGMVTDGKRPLGVLYGAGAVQSLDRNRIFARWLQKRVGFETTGGNAAAEGRAKGPHRLQFPLRGAARGRFVVYGDDGTTVRYRGPEVTIHPGEVWRYRGG